MDGVMKHTDSGVILLAAILDFSKAFDKVSHQLLVAKLLESGFYPAVINWTSNFLTYFREW